MLFTTASAPTARRTPPIRSRGLLGAAAAGLLLLSGCGLLGDGPGPAEATLLPEGTTEVELEVGETAQVSLGMGSQGIGDSWGVISQSQEGVASAEVVLDEKVLGVDEGEDAPGASMPFAVELSGQEPGTTTVRVLYCTRTAIAEDCDQTQGTLEPPVAPVEIIVVVR